tara:strand:- start:43303 stop:43851 length:549 start_codon:yes stop_codon:yes gene_type:complete
MSKAIVYWYCGLSGSGKTTVTDELIKLLNENNIRFKVFDGDIVREKHHKQLDFSKSDILENNRLISQMCVEHQNDNDIILAPIISPFNQSRDDAKRLIGEENFRLIYFSANLETVVERDVKGLYQKAKDGVIKEMIGFNDNSPFEVPNNYDLNLNSGDLSVSPKTFAEKFFNLIESDLKSKT